jgi:hypothetical protein
MNGHEAIETVRDHPIAERVATEDLVAVAADGTRHHALQTLAAIMEAETISHEGMAKDVLLLALARELRRQVGQLDGVAAAELTLD